MTCLCKALSAKNAHNTCKMGYGLGNEFVDDVFGFAALLFSWITNLWATGLIAYKAWCVFYTCGEHAGYKTVDHRQHRHLVRRNLNGKSIGSQTNIYLMLFVDSGAIYCVLWVLSSLSES